MMSSVLDKAKMLYGNTLVKISDNIYSFGDNGRYFVILDNNVINTGRVKIQAADGTYLYGIEYDKISCDRFIFNRDLCSMVNIEHKKLETRKDIAVVSSDNSIEIYNKELKLIRTEAVKDMVIIRVSISDAGIEGYNIVVNGYDEADYKLKSCKFYIGREEIKI